MKQIASIYTTVLVKMIMILNKLNLNILKYEQLMCSQMVCKITIIPLLMYWSYHNVVPNHWFGIRVHLYGSINV